MLYPFVRPFSSTVPHHKDHKNTETEPTEPHGEGEYARTDESVRFQYPGEEHLPPTPISPDHRGIHLKRSLAAFSLENKVSVVTGGASGLGLAMSHAITNSGSDLAIVDLSGMLRQSPRL